MKDDDRAQDKLERMATHFNDIGLYTKEAYCYNIAEYITELEQKIQILEKNR